MLTPLLAVLGGCEPRHDATDDACRGGTCITIEDDDGESALGVSDVGHMTVNGLRSLCRLVVRRPASLSVAGFEGVTVASPEDVTILDGALGKVQRCSTHGGHMRAVILLNPASYAWAVPDRGNVFIPFSRDEESTLGGDSSARAIVDSDANGSRLGGHYCIVYWQHGTTQKVQCDVHIGDTFPWGAHRGEIVRIVPPSLAFTGWMEVALR
jgi:hypothetical protein